MLESVYYPIKPNVHWFTSRENFEKLRNHIKTMLLFYENIYLENYHFQLIDDGKKGMQFQIPIDVSGIPDEMPWEIKDMEMKVGIKHESQPATDKYQLLASYKPERFFTASFNYFRTMIDGINENEMIVKFGTLIDELDPYAKDFVARRLEKDYQNEKLMKNIDLPSYTNEFIMRNLYYYHFYSYFTKTPMVYDEHHTNLLHYYANITNYEKGLRREEIEGDVVNHFINVYFPDVSQLLIDDLIDLRKEKSVNDISRFISRVADRTIDEQGKVEDIFPHEQMKDIQEFLPSKKKTAISFFVGLIPNLGTVLTTGSEVEEIMRYEDHWYSFVSNYDQIQTEDHYSLSPIVKYI